MGYTTKFTGHLTITGADSIQKFDISDFLPKDNKTIIDDLVPNQALYLINLLSATRRMKRDMSVFTRYPNYFGVNGEFYADTSKESLEDFGQIPDESILDFNSPSLTQPSLWCQWVIKTTKDNKLVLRWDGREKFYCYTEWLTYLVKNICTPKGIKLNGTMHWKGEMPDDIGVITVTDNVIHINK